MISVDQLYRRLSELLGDSIRNPRADGQWIQFDIEAVAGAAVRVAADRSTGVVQISGRPPLTASWARVVGSLDQTPTATAGQPAAGQPITRLMSTRGTPREDVRKVVDMISLSSAEAPLAGRSRAGDKASMVAMLFQPGQQPQQPGGEAEPPDTPPQEAPDAQPEDGMLVEPEDNEETLTGAGLIGPVQVDFIPELDILVVRGSDRDVAMVMKIINDIEALTKVTEPKVEVYRLQHVQSAAMAALIRQVYDEVLASRQGGVSITPLVKPNALLLIGRPENVDTVMQLIDKLDQPVTPETEFEVFPLEYASAVDAKVVIDEFFEERTGLGTKVLATADFRSNSLIVSASPRDMLEVRALIARLDTDRIASKSEVKVFFLRNSYAEDLVEVLRDALTPQGQQAAQQQPAAGGTAAQAGAKSRMLRLTIDPNGRDRLLSGVLTDVQVTADARANAIVVTAGADSMNLIAALIEELDRVPDAAAELKVFPVENGDAASLVEMLQSLFGEADQQGAPAVGGIGGGGSTIVPLRFSIDERTNSILAAGTAKDLAVVEAVILRLDITELEQRVNRVYKLRNASAEAVAESLTTLLRQEREIQDLATATQSPFEQIEREVVVVPEIGSNSLIVSTTPRFFDQVSQLIREIDERPPMVLVQVLIAEVSLNDTDEFGVELGLQDSLLFDRSLLDNIVTTTNTTTTQTPGGATTTFQEQIIQAATLAPGFAFNGADLGNAGSDLSLGTRGNVGTQGISNFGVNRINSELGFGGFVFSASNENLSVLLRALQESRRLEVLSRPQIMAMDSQQAFVQVGQRVPTIRGTTVNQTGQVNTIEFVNVGLILQVVPRISPDGLVVMNIDAERSDVGPEAEGIPVSISATGQVVRSPRINIITASTTVHAMSGQTIVLGGLIVKRSSDVHRRVPLISDIPLLGDLFRFDSVQESRSELLIIMTPRVVRNQLDADLIKQVEASRMNWVISDVVDLYGPAGLRQRNDMWTDVESEACYPTEVPSEELTPPLPSQPLPPSATQLPPLEPPVDGAFQSHPDGIEEASYQAPVPLPRVTDE